MHHKYPIICSNIDIFRVGPKFIVAELSASYGRSKEQFWLSFVEGRSHGNHVSYWLCMKEGCIGEKNNLFWYI